LAKSGSILTETSKLLPGDHLCCIYETDVEHRAILTPYLRDGLERNEKVVYIVDARTADTVVDYLRQDGLDTQPFLEKGQLVILSVAEAYMRDGRFDPERMISLLRQETDRAMSEGYTALRVTGEMSWALKGLPGSDRLIEYESKLNNFFPGSGCIAVCQYDRRRFSPELLLQVLATHPIAVIGTEVYENFHFVPPERFLIHDFPTAILDHWIEGLRIRRLMKWGEEALRESEEQFRAIFENSKDGVLLTVPDGSILAANPPACEILGRTEEEVCMAGRAGVVDMSDPRLPSLLEERARTGMCIGEMNFVRKDGTKFPVELSSRVYKDRYGNPRTSMVFRDITERKRAESVLVAQSQLLEAFFNNNFMAIALLDREFNFLRVNDMYARYDDRNAADFPGHDHFELYPSSAKAIFEEVVATRKPYVAYARPFVYAAHPERGVTYWDWALVPLLDKGGEVQSLLFTLTDVTGRQRAEEALRESESKYRLLVQNATDAIVIAQDGVIKFANPMAERITGYSSEELGRLPFLDLVHPEDRETVGEQHMKRLAGEVLPAAYSFRIRNKAGDELWVQLSTTLIDWEGRPATLDFVRDVTLQRKLESQLFVSQKMDAVGRLAGGVAHDFNNLLTAIIGYCDQALSRIDREGPLGRDIGEILKASNRCARLTQQLLAFSRKQIMLPKVIDLNGVVADMDNLLRRLIGENIRLVSVPGKDLWSVKVDPGQIEQVIANLAINSRDSMPRGGKLTIETANVELDDLYSRGHETVKPGPYVRLTVSDTGCGMDEGTMARIFEPFFTTKEKGTGLGLSTAYGIVKQSGGSIDVYSEPGIGTTIKIYIPRVTEEAVAIARPGVIPFEKLRGSETILVVEDEDIVRILVRQILAHYGYDVLDVGCGEEAVDVCSRRKAAIHLMLTDVVLPDMTGVDLSRRLAAILPEMKVIFMSGYTNVGVLQEGILESDVAFIQKPFTSETLACKIREALDSKSTVH
jgi:PAS domain S-box-containing protein